MNIEPETHSLLEWQTRIERERGIDIADQRIFFAPRQPEGEIILTLIGDTWVGTVWICKRVK